MIRAIKYQYQWAHHANKYAIKIITARKKRKFKLFFLKKGYRFHFSLRPPFFFKSGNMIQTFS